MSKEIFIANCIAATDTLTEGQDYEVVSEDPWQIVVINNSGNKITVMRDRFTEVKLKNVKTDEEMKVTCINAANFRNLVVGKTYNIAKQTPDYYYITSPKGTDIRYHKKYFESISGPKTEAPTPHVPKTPPAPPKNMMTCDFPINGELIYKKSYEVISSTDTHVKVKNEKGVVADYLFKRFSI